MSRHLTIFVLTFVIGALIAVVLRTATHRPYDPPQPTTHVAAPSAIAPAPAVATPTAHATHGGAAAPAATAAAATPVNTICAICGMPVDPALGTATYQGQVIGFGCKACPSTFSANPDKYGPSALKNQVVE